MNARTANARNTPLHTHYMCFCKLQFRPSLRAICLLRKSGGSAHVITGRAPQRRPPLPPFLASSGERRHGQGESGQKSSAEKANITPNKGTMPRPVDLQTSKEPRSPRDENTHGSVPAPRREEATRIISGGPQRKPIYFFTNESCEPGEKAKL